MFPFKPVTKLEDLTVWPADNAFDADKSITRASEKGLGPGNGDFFGFCEMASSRQASAIWGRKKSRFPGPNPLALAQVMDLLASKALHTGRINQRSIGSFMYMSSPTGDCNRL
jgi:hypothetical protein